MAIPPAQATMAMIERLSSVADGKAIAARIRTMNPNTRSNEGSFRFFCMLNLMMVNSESDLTLKHKGG